MHEIFISYRHGDSGGWVTAIYEELIDYFAREQIFRDLDAIGYGKDFLTEIDQALQRCDVLLAIIGPRWSTITDNAGNKRLDDENDVVRMEIATVLERENCVVLPVLVGGAKIPRVDDLPDVLQPLCRRNAFSIDNRSFKSDVLQLVKELSRMLSIAAIRRTPVDNGLPVVRPSATTMLPQPFDWVTIPGGRVDAILGLGRKSVAPFEMARYPITNAQFQVFIQDEDGYSNAGWWGFSEAARLWRMEFSQPEPTRFTAIDVPRTNVTWYEAVAFCRWLSAKTGDNVSLPTELQWRRGAQGDDGRMYPWGNDDPTADRCNFGDDVDYLTPVTQYPDGASPYGVMDMSGNADEWCLNTFYDPGQIKLESADFRAIRGGSFGPDNRSHLRVMSRNRIRPDYASEDVGFRIVCNGRAKE